MPDPSKEDALEHSAVTTPFLRGNANKYSTMAIHPIDYRYGTPEMRAVWSEENRFRAIVMAEVALAGRSGARDDPP